jgi:hypothetical protein
VVVAGVAVKVVVAVEVVVAVVVVVGVSRMAEIVAPTRIIVSIYIPGTIIRLLFIVQ